MGSFSIWHWIVVFALAGAAAVVPLVLFCNSLAKTLDSVDPSLREQQPGVAWLLLIPVFNVIWIFVMAIAVKKGYTRMSAAGRLSRPSDGEWGLGLATAILWALCLVPYVNFLVMIPAVIVWIIYWVKLVDLRRLVQHKAVP